MEKKTVAIVGFGKSMKEAFALPPEIDIWTLNDAPEHGFTKIDALFDLHKPIDIAHKDERWLRLTQEQPYPIYMLEEHSNFPSAKRYPIEKVRELVFENLYAEDEHARYLTSSFPYMVALAVLEGYECIICLGFEFGTETEYRYQRDGATFILGWAAGKGVEIRTTADVFPPSLYGYEDFQMISRQSLEGFLVTIKEERSHALAKLNSAHSRCVEREKEGLDTKEVAEERNSAFKEVYMADGAIQVLNYLIDVCDRKTAKFEMRHITGMRE